MSLSDSFFNSLMHHWAIEAVGTENVLAADQLANERLAYQALGQEIQFSFTPSATDDPLLERVALAYEMAAIEGLDELSRPSGNNQALRELSVSASFKAFDLRRLMPLPRDTGEKLFFVLQISALAYCGDRWTDLRRWYNDHEFAIGAPSTVNVDWDRRVLYRLFDCWVRLFRKRGWEDLDQIREIISGLREDQKTYERQQLEKELHLADKATALRLVALYHWAKATEILASYMLQGQPANPFGEIDKHFDSAIHIAASSSDARLDIVLRWLHATSRIMVTNSLWWATRTVNSKTSEFVRSMTHRSHQSMFELLPPQRAALVDKGLLDQAKTAIVVDLPTSGGKTLLAQFRILQALNQFHADKGWVVYVAPTRALAGQITRRLRQDFEPIGLRVEQLTAAVEVDAFEEELLADVEQPFHILVATPEKLALVIRNKKISRPLALVVMDEAHNLETEGRGLRIELLLATVKRDCPTANFLLMMPYTEGSESVARWLAHDVSAGQSISLGTTPWKPNERVIGLYRAMPDDTERSGWHLVYETLTATPKAMPLHGQHVVGGVKPLNLPKSQVLNKGSQKGFAIQTAAMSAVLSARGTSIAVANRIPTVWKMAKEIAAKLPAPIVVSEDVRLVQAFLRSEISEDFPLIKMLESGVGVHHAGLSDDVRSLIEWLAENGNLRVLCATSTIAQGINFPVSSVFLASRFVPKGQQSVEMAPREFWNLVGRAGRIGQDSIGVVGLAEGTDRQASIDFISRNTGALVSRLVTLMDELAEQGDINRLSDVLWQDQWEDFRCYIAHLWAEKKNLDAVLADTEQLLRQTYGYTSLRNDPNRRAKADALLEATQNYARKLADNPGYAELADSTGFSPEGIAKALKGMSSLEKQLTPSDWAPDSLFGDAGKMSDLFGVMLKVPQLKQLEEVGGDGQGNSRLSEITLDWVNGKSINAIAKEYFAHDDSDEGKTAAITDACRSIYRAIVNNGTWGLSALSRLSGVDFEKLPESQRRQINALPAMIYHGVKTEDAVLMRMNSAPRSAAESLGNLYKTLSDDDDQRLSVSKARTFLKTLSGSDWDRVRPKNSSLTGAEYRRVWRVLSGETN